MSAIQRVDELIRVLRAELTTDVASTRGPAVHSPRKREHVPASLPWRGQRNSRANRGATGGPHRESAQSISADQVQW